MKESDIQKQILDYLRLKGCLVFKVNNGGVYIKKLNRYMKSPQKGISDIVGETKKGLFLAIEVKKKYNKPSPEQLDFIEQVKARGGIGLVAYCLEDVMKII